MSERGLTFYELVLRMREWSYKGWFEKIFEIEKRLRWADHLAEKKVSLVDRNQHEWLLRLFVLERLRAVSGKYRRTLRILFSHG